MIENVDCGILSETRIRDVDERHRAWKRHSVLGVEDQTSRVQRRRLERNGFFYNGCQFVTREWRGNK
jgi:hypothetical protein